MSYDPIKYWVERGETYQDRFVYNEKYRLQEAILRLHLQKLQFESVLEVGCGFGRITRLVSENFDVKEYLAIDISADQILNAQKNVDRPVHFHVSTIQDFSGKKQYDLVLASEVLLHVLPSEIEAVITKLLSLAKRHLVHIDPYNMKGKLASHNFMHEYPAIYHKIAPEAKLVLVPVGDIGQYVIHAEK